MSNRHSVSRSHRSGKRSASARATTLARRAERTRKYGQATR